MGNLANVGIFFAGLGVLLLSCGYCWKISLQSKEMKKKDLI